MNQIDYKDTKNNIKSLINYEVIKDVFEIETNFGDNEQSIF